MAAWQTQDDGDGQAHGDAAQAGAGIGTQIDVAPDAADATPGAAEATADAATGGGFIGHAALVAALTFLSRLTGLVRDAVLAAAFGLSGVADAFFIGFLIPNLFRRLFGEGALSAAFIPHYTDLLKHDRALARRFASLCLGLLTTVLAAITLLGEGLLILLASRESWSQETHLALRFTMIMLPYMPLICLVALIGGVLQVHGRFGAPAAAPILLNLVMIVAAVIGGFALDEGSMRRAATIVAWSVLAAGLLQLAWQAAALLRVEGLTFRLAGTGRHLRSMLLMMLPMLIGLAVFQINAFLDSLIAFALSAREGGPTHLHVLGHDIPYPIQGGAVAALQWSQRLYQFPLGVFGIAIATAIFPALAHASADASDAGRADFRRILQQGLRLTVFIGLPASVGLILVRTPLSRVVYERGQFSLDDALRVAHILAGYSAAICAYSMTHVLTRAFYAHKDARTPLRISLVMVGFNFLLNVVLIWPLGAAGLAWSTAISASLQVLLLILAVRRYVDRPVDGTVWHGWARTVLLSAVMAAVLMPILRLYPPATLTRWGAAAQLGAMVGLGAAVFAAGAWLLRVEELRWLGRRRKT